MKKTKTREKKEASQPNINIKVKRYIEKKETTIKQECSNNINRIKINWVATFLPSRFYHLGF